MKNDKKIHWPEHQRKDLHIGDSVRVKVYVGNDAKQWRDAIVTYIHPKLWHYSARVTERFGSYVTDFKWGFAE